jgi:RNA polymerase sigma-70 factor (ECF subfamily)
MTSLPSSGVRDAAGAVERVDDDLIVFVERHYPARDAEDAVQAALEKAWRGRHGLRDSDRLKPWLDRIVVREAIRAARGPSLLARFLPSPREIAVGDAGSGPTTTTDLDRRADLRAAYAALPPGQRAVVALHLHAGYSVAETAEVVGIPLETARSRLRLARERLRESLREDAR